MGEVKTPLSPFLSRGAGHDPLREVLLLLRAAVTIPCKSPYSSLGLPSQYPKRGPYSSAGLQVTIPCERSLILLRAAVTNPWAVLSQVRQLRLMVTMATNPFRESMVQRVTCMGALHPLKYTKCIPHRRNNPAQNMVSYIYHLKTDTRPQKGGDGDMEYISRNMSEDHRPKVRL